MAFSSFPLLLTVALAGVNQALAHSVITQVVGANGVVGAGFGVIADTPRDGTRRNPFQQDASIIRTNEITSGKTDACGRTLAGGNNDIAASLANATAAGLPTTSATGELTLTIHQVNGDGAGPYTCDVSTDGGATFTAATVVTDVPGRRGRSDARATDFPLVLQMAATTTCTGGTDGNACIARCFNPARAGPFGGCVAFTTVDSASTTDTTTATDTTTTATDTTTTAAETIATDTTVADTTTTAADTTTVADTTTAADTTVAAAESTATDATVTEATSIAEISATETASSIEATATGATVEATSAETATATAETTAAAETTSAAEPAAVTTATAEGEAAKVAAKAAAKLVASKNHAKRGVGNSEKTKRTKPSFMRKRQFNSRIAGRRAGLWLDA